MKQKKADSLQTSPKQSDRILKRVWNRTPKLWTFRKTTTSSLQQYYHFSQYEKRIEQTRDQLFKRGFGQDIF